MAEKAFPATSSGNQAPPIAENTNMTIRHRTMTWSSFLASAPMSSPRLAAHSARATIMSRMAAGLAQVVHAEDQLAQTNQERFLGKNHQEHGQDMPANHFRPFDRRGQQALQAAGLALQHQEHAGVDQTENRELHQHPGRGLGEPGDLYARAGGSSLPGRLLDLNGERWLFQAETASWNDSWK